MTTVVAKSWRFDAAHQLLNHDGKCAQPHGHTYTLTVAVRGHLQPADGRPQEGMVVDFAVLDRAWKDIEPSVDHQDLNVTLRDVVPVTTSEHLAAYFMAHFRKWLRGSVVDVAWVRLSETPSSYAEVRP